MAKSTYTIRDRTEETSCDYCGCPLYVGDRVLECDPNVYCSRACIASADGAEVAA